MRSDARHRAHTHMQLHIGRLKSCLSLHIAHALAHVHSIGSLKRTFHMLYIESDVNCSGFCSQDGYGERSLLLVATRKTDWSRGKVERSTFCS